MSWILIFIPGFLFVEYIYHSLFRPIYIGSGTLLRELIICFFLSILLDTLVIKYWFIAVPIIIILIVAAINKRKG